MRIRNHTDYPTPTIRFLANHIFRNYATQGWNDLTRNNFLYIKYYSKYYESDPRGSPIGPAQAHWRDDSGEGGLEGWYITLPSVGCSTESIIRVLYLFATRGRVWQVTPLPWWDPLIQKHGLLLWSIPKTPSE